MLIPLTQGKFAIVDDSDYEWLMQWKWTFNCGYAVRVYRKYPKQFKVRMHRLIAGTPEGMETDHINRNKLDNRRSNLRVCSSQINRMNRNVQANSTTGFKGVSFIKRENKFVAYIGSRKTRKYIGRFDNPIDAHTAFVEAEKRKFTELCSL